MTDGNTSQITNTHYSEGFQYTEDHLDFFPHAEGYVNVIDYSAFNYVYTYKDHLGNIRLKYTLDPDTNETAILEENHYYPYGLTHQGYNADHKFLLAIDEIIEIVEVTSIMDDKYKYKFNGMEWQNELDLNHYDFGARNYDAALGRTFTPDPLGEVFYHLSPYSFLNNNPLNSIDPTGALTLEGQAARDYFQQLKDEIASKPRKRKEEEEEDIENDPPDYFDKETGEYLGKGGTDDIRFISKADWDEGQLQNYSRFANNSKIEAMVYLFYAQNYNLIPQDAKGAMFCCENINGWSTSHQDGILSFNFARNTIGLDILNRFDAINILVHELGSHGVDYLSGKEYIIGVNDHEWEYRATRAEINDWSWAGTSPTYKKETYRYYGRFLTPSEIEKFFNKYNVGK